MGATDPRERSPTWGDERRVKGEGVMREEPRDQEKEEMVQERGQGKVKYKVIWHKVVW